MNNQASKKRKLSLKKPNGSNTVNQPDEKKNTIISMFQKQSDKQTVKVETKESGSEGDVIITNVIGLDADASCQNLAKPVSTSNKNHQGDSSKRLSLSGKKRKKPKDTNDDESASDSDFDVKKSKRKEKKRHSLSRSKSAQESRPQGGPYRLRKRNTVPVVELSDNDTEKDEGTDTKSKIRKKTDHYVPNVPPDNDSGNGEENETNSEVGKKSDHSIPSKDDHNVKHRKCNQGIDMKVESNDDEDVSIVPTKGSKSKYFSNSGKRKLSNSSEKLKLSLKRSRSGKEAEQKHDDSKQQETLDIESDRTQIEQDTPIPKDKSESLDTAVKKGIKDKSTSRISNVKVYKKDPSDQESHTNLEKDKAEKDNNKNSQNSNLNSILMPKAGGSNDKDNGRKDSRKDKRSDKEKSSSHNKSLGNSKTNKRSTKLGKGQEDKKTGKTNDKANVDSNGVDSNDIDGDKVKVDVDDEDSGADEDAVDGVTEDGDTVEYRIPYYLENFNKIVESVLDDKENARLFDEVDMNYITTFNELEEASQKVYVRLFSRKLSWLPMSKVNYPEISDNIPELIDGLIDTGLLHSGSELSDLPTILKILSAPDLKTLAKSFHINGQGMTKASMIEELLKKGKKNSISTMFKGGSTGTMEKTILNRAKGYLGKVCRLKDEPRAVFIRLLMLFSLYNTNFDEDSGGGGQNQLFQMLMVNIGRVVYPSFTVHRDRSVFQDRAALVRFEVALQFEIDIQSWTERNKWTQAYDIFKQAKSVGKVVCQNKQYMNWDKGLPQFLRLYTAGSVYTRIDNQGVEILQRLKLYKEAVDLLEELLAQDLYCVQYRGHWYERLALNLEAHLKSVQKSFDVLKRGLSDPTVRTGRRLALYERARKICEAPKSKYADRLSEFEHDKVLPTPEVHIDGMVVSDATAVGMKYKFVMQGDSDSVTFCGVEELVLEHYKQNGYPEGLHAEGSIVSNLFVLLFWDIMFMDVPNVFHGPFQSCPLDIATQDFYQNRQQPINERLKWLKDASVEELNTEVSRIWEEHEAEMCSGINWDKFSGPDTHQDLISCMGGAKIAGILERYVKDPRHTRSGFPDLTLWNTETKQFKICEVKGPNDRLSYKQILWIDYLQKLGVDAEVCYVKEELLSRYHAHQKQEKALPDKLIYLQSTCHMIKML